MQYRILGRTHLKVSVIGMGTAQLRMVPEKQAIETLIGGFRRGINIVHVAPDYEGAEYIVAKAVSEAPHPVIVCGQAYDRQFNACQPVTHFEMLFERLCQSLDSPQLDIFGISCIDDRERFEENVWGKGGMIEFLQKKKSAGRLNAIFCTTHGSPEYIKEILKKDVFDVIMIPYNLMGFHLLSSPPSNNNNHEDLIRNGTEILTLAEKNGIGLMIMKALAGGLMCNDAPVAQSCMKAIRMDRPRVFDILRLTVSDQRIHTAMVGVTSPEEADEIARAGYLENRPHASCKKDLMTNIANLTELLCSRCGHCDTQCSRNLPVSWMIRAGYVALCADSNYETWEDIEYFRLYTDPDLPCQACQKITCCCPSGIDIPGLLTEIHQKMKALSASGEIQPRLPFRPPAFGDKDFGGRMVYRKIPQSLPPGAHGQCRIFLENTGTRGWFKKENPYRAHVRLGIYVDGKNIDQIPIREDTHPGERIHFTFNIVAPKRLSSFQLSLKLLGEHFGFDDRQGLILLEKTIAVRKSAES
jgi:predicted aldo/keto reductase-like oxidoreductase